MKKLVSIMLFFASLPLISQYRYTFPEYMENLQKSVPLKAIEWFNENAYSSSYGVSENIFAFYRGISRYLSYVKYNGPVDDLDRAAGDFKQAIDIPHDPKYLYRDRSLLYLAGILTISQGEKELAARIFKYYADNCEQYDANYPTAIYWALYHKYIPRETYQFYYNTLLKLDSMGVYDYAIIFDYFSGENKSIREMLGRLESPANMTQNRYRRISENTDVFNAIKSIIPIVPETEKSMLGATYQYIIFDPYPPVRTATSSRSLSTNASPVRTNNYIQPVRTNNYVPPVRTNYTAPAVSTNRIISTGANTNSGVASLVIVVEKNSSENVRIDIGGRTFNTASSTSFALDLSVGEHEVTVSFLGRLYRNKVSVVRGSYNLLSILINNGNLRIR